MYIFFRKKKHFLSTTFMLSIITGYIDIFVMGQRLVTDLTFSESCECRRIIIYSTKDHHGYYWLPFTQIQLFVMRRLSLAHRQEIALRDSQMKFCGDQSYT